jgi:cytochrome c-type biogenesis protein CcmE
MAYTGERVHRVRAIVVIALIVVGLGLLLTRCPSNRDGMPGQLAQSMEQTTTAARTGAMALNMWIGRRSTSQLASVQLSDARDEVLKAYKGIADLSAQDPVDVRRQRMLTESMTTIIGQLNAAAATIRHITSEPTVEKARADLMASADALESGYR